MKNETKISFVTNAISDAQELIRFADAKTTFVITILGAFIVAFFTVLDNIVKYANGYSAWFWAFLGIFFLLLCLCIVIVTRIVKPINNPMNNLIFGEKVKQSPAFYLAPNTYPRYSLFPFRNSSRFKLFQEVENYRNQLSQADEDQIIDSLTIELLKVSFIRNIKNDRFDVLVRFLIVTTVFFVVTFIFYSIETQQAINELEKMTGT